jgi:hypothetical protein
VLNDIVEVFRVSRRGRIETGPAHRQDARAMFTPTSLPRQAVGNNFTVCFQYFSLTPDVAKLDELG